eukprot:1159892-Pelagomonas_calceolata.AAC.35
MLNLRPAALQPHPPAGPCPGHCHWHRGRARPPRSTHQGELAQGVEQAWAGISHLCWGLDAGSGGILCDPGQISVWTYGLMEYSYWAQ